MRDFADRERDTFAALERCEADGLYLSDLAHQALRLLCAREFTPRWRAILAGCLLQQVAIFALAPDDAALGDAGRRETRAGHMPAD